MLHFSGWQMEALATRAQTEASRNMPPRCLLPVLREAEYGAWCILKLDVVKRSLDTSDKASLDHWQTAETFSQGCSSCECCGDSVVTRP